ncbi:tRNA epoxyqueuosine(34) reductase QueG [Marinobacterium aestuariivivens]|uniref:Epoxyqueuosine reductase n=1 Tax=Marinobacterium aestuariivivens TaxID=1698799 RepID=A0ABW2A2H4_9GAMM
MNTLSASQLEDLACQIKQWAAELGFQQCGITGTDLSSEGEHLREWLARGYQGEMGYLENHFDKRLDPTLLVPGTRRIISVRMDYLPPDVKTLGILKQRDKAYIARYTLGRDYHKTMRKRLTRLGQRIEQACDALGYRAFVDSAPVLERPLAREAGIGWQGKHSLILNREAGSWFLLGELFVDLPLPLDEPYEEEHCGRCTACLDICPTGAFPAPGVLDARRCISYLTIEYRGSIEPELRPLIGNRIFGCDDCQLICPWNRFARHSGEADFQPRHRLDDIDLLELFEWSEEAFLRNTEGSAIRRTGYEGWQRNLAVALGNGSGGPRVERALEARRETATALVREHIDWALERLRTGPNAVPLPIVEHPRARKLPE